MILIDINVINLCNVRNIRNIYIFIGTFCYISNVIKMVMN